MKLNDISVNLICNKPSKFNCCQCSWRNAWASSIVCYKLWHKTTKTLNHSILYRTFQYYRFHKYLPVTYNSWQMNNLQQSKRFNIHIRLWWKIKIWLSNIIRQHINGSFIFPFRRIYECIYSYYIFQRCIFMLAVRDIWEAKQFYKILHFTLEYYTVLRNGCTKQWLFQRNNM